MIMEKQGKVSLWVGDFDSKEEFYNFIKEVYDDEGEVSSDFMEVFQIDYIDNQYQEVYFYEDVSSKKKVFEGFSYIESFVDNVPDMKWIKKNVVLLLYNFEYSKKKNYPKMKFIDVYDFIED